MVFTNIGRTGNEAAVAAAGTRACGLFVRVRQLTRACKGGSERALLPLALQGRRVPLGPFDQVGKRMARGRRLPAAAKWQQLHSSAWLHGSKPM